MPAACGTKRCWRGKATFVLLTLLFPSYACAVMGSHLNAGLGFLKPFFTFGLAILGGTLLVGWEVKIKTGYVVKDPRKPCGSMKKGPLLAIPSHT